MRAKKSGRRSAVKARSRNYHDMTFTNDGPLRWLSTLNQPEQEDGTNTSSKKIAVFH